MFFMKREESWPIFGIGLVLEGEDIDDFLRRAGYKDVYDFVDDHIRITNVEYYGDEAEGKTFKNIVGESRTLKEALVFFSKKQSSFFEAPYNDEKELLDEFKSVVGDVFEDDIDYMRHIGLFSCTVFC